MWWHEIKWKAKTALLSQLQQSIKIKTFLILVNDSADCCCDSRGKLLIPSTKNKQTKLLFHGVWRFFARFITSWSIVSTECCWRCPVILELVIDISLEVLFYLSRSQQGTSHKWWDWVHVLTGETLGQDILFKLMNVTVSSDCFYWGPTLNGISRVLTGLSLDVRDFCSLLGDKGQKEDGSVIEFKSSLWLKAKVLGKTIGLKGYLGWLV